MTTFGGFRTMWLVTMFDLPTDSAEARRNYTDFRKALLQDGFIMMQYSVYIRHCASEENAAVHKKRVNSVLPPEGEIRLLTLTDYQFGKMEVFHGKKAKETEKAPEQISFF